MEIGDFDVRFRGNDLADKNLECFLCFGEGRNPYKPPIKNLVGQKTTRNPIEITYKPVGIHINYQGAGLEKLLAKICPKFQVQGAVNVSQDVAERVRSYYLNSQRGIPN